MDREFLQILNLTGAAAALLEDGSVSWCSDGARRLGLLSGTAAAALLPEGELPGDALFPVPALGPQVVGRAARLDGGTLLLLRDEQEPLSIDTLGQISRVLSGSIEDILFTGQTLFERLEALEDPAVQAGTAHLMRNFYRLLRTSSALLDQYDSAHGAYFAPERIDIRRWLREQADRLCAAVASTGRTLAIDLPERHLYLPADTALLEQALLALLSNAIAYSPAGSDLRLQVVERSEHCVIELRNPISEPVSFPELGGAFTRPIGPEDRGLGLGLRRVRQIARLHGGTLLLSCGPDGCFSATVCIPCRRPEAELRGPAMPMDRSGGYSRLLVELADVLPDEAYDSRNL